MGGKGRPLFDLNELPSIQDDSDSALPSPSEKQAQNVRASSDPDPGISTPVSLFKSSEAQAAADPCPSSLGTLVQVSASKLGSLPHISSPIPATRSQCTDAVPLPPGQHPLSCFRPFSSFQSFVRQNQMQVIASDPASVEQSKPDPGELVLDMCDSVKNNVLVSPFRGDSTSLLAGESDLPQNLTNEKGGEMEDGEVCGFKEVQVDGDNMSKDTRKTQSNEDHVSKGHLAKDSSGSPGSSDEKFETSSAATERQIDCGGSDSDDIEKGEDNYNTYVIDAKEPAESASADVTLEDFSDVVQDSASVMEDEANGGHDILSHRSAPIDSFAKEAGIGVNPLVSGDGKFSTSFNKRFMPEQKKAMPGKKRSRQTVFLDIKEAVRQAGPKSSTLKKSISSFLPSRPMKDSPQTPLAQISVEKMGDFTPKSIPLLKDQKQLVNISDTGSAASSVESRKNIFLVASEGSRQSQTIPSKKSSDNSMEGALPQPTRHNSSKQSQLDDKQKQVQFIKTTGKTPVVVGQGKVMIEERLANLPHRPLVKKNTNARKQTASGNVYHVHDSSIERLHREATCEKLWRSPGDAELQRVPGSFKSVDGYVRVFEPLLFEECRAQLHSTWEELCDAVSKDVHIAVSIKMIEKRERGWYDVVLLPMDSRVKLFFKEGDVAILSTPKPGSAGSTKRRSNGTCNDDAPDVDHLNRIAGIVRRYFPVDTRNPHGAILHFHTGESNVDPTTEDHAFKKFQSKEVTWYLTVLGSLATTQREYVALHAFQHLHSQMVKAILQPKPDLFPDYEAEPPAMPDCFTQHFVQHLHKSFNGPQLAAIQWAAMHTAAGTSSSNGAGKRQELWPFTLVQGPPGTGKTHTVWGMLNVIHLVQYQRYYAALLKKLAPESLRSTDETVDHSNLFSGDGIGSIDEVLQKMDQSLARVLPKLCPKPRMLVCAPSNAATDEMLTRVLERGFIDGEMRIYRPDVARVGIDTQSRAAQAVSVERRSDQLLGMGRDEVMGWLHQLRSRETVLAQQIACLQKELSATAAAARSQGTIGVDPEVLAARDQSRDSRLQQLAAVVEERDKVLVEMSRLFIVQGRFRPGSGISLDARAKLEASFANEAEIVFTTVSSSGRRIFNNLAHGFDMVVIDEAAQASEVAVLPPLGLGAARCVLVGDPQQLPATVISRAADTLQYSRSLFERFQQAGCPTILLSVQYRMHPQIRDFPSRYFYQNRLVDSESVKALADEVYHKDPMLRPYLFYDISHGRESHKGGSVSYQNILEAQFAARLYEYLQNALKSAGIGKVSVGVITPYKLQLKCLQQEFESVLGSDAESKGVYINTVDAFQGQERDVIMMSCVRASSHGVGFVADIRRMNVALTRARRCLWVMGNATALMQSEDWAALISDAKERGCFVTMSESTARGLSVCKPSAFVPSSQGRAPGLVRVPRPPGIMKGGTLDPSPESNTLQGNGNGHLLNNVITGDRPLGQTADSIRDEPRQNDRIRDSLQRPNRDQPSLGVLQGSPHLSQPDRNAGKMIRRNKGF